MQTVESEIKNQDLAQNEQCSDSKQGKSRQVVHCQVNTALYDSGKLAQPNPPPVQKNGRKIQMVELILPVRQVLYNINEHAVFHLTRGAVTVAFFQRFVEQEDALR